MSTITTEEIMLLYKKCGTNPNSSTNIRTNINFGNLDNKLNTNYVSAYNNTTGHELSSNVKS